MKYRELLKHHFVLEAGRLSVKRWYWFMQDGACPNRIYDVFTWLEMTFAERLIALHAEKFARLWIEWSPIQVKPKSMRRFLWGYIKDRIYRNLPDSLKDKCPRLGTVSSST